MPLSSTTPYPLALAGSVFKFSETAVTSSADAYKHARTHPDPASNASRNVSFGLFSSNKSVTVVNEEGKNDCLIENFVKGVAIGAGIAVGVAAVAITVSKMTEWERERERKREERGREMKMVGCCGAGRGRDGSGMERREEEGEIDNENLDDEVDENDIENDAETLLFGKQWN